MADDIRGIPVALPPASLWDTEPFPSGDSPHGKHLALNPANGHIDWLYTHLACGPSALHAHFPLTGNQDNWLVGPVNYADHGFRSELVAYIPRGVWNLYGTLVIAGPTNVEYDIIVLQGHGQSADPGRVGIACDNPQVVGGGVGTWTGAAHMPFSIPFSAHVIQYAGEPGQACEISVSVYPKYSGPAGSALAVVGGPGMGVPVGHVSQFMITRVRGL